MNDSFFDRLFTDDEFVQALGRLVLSSAKFETTLKQYMDEIGNAKYSEKAPLGRLLKTLMEHHYIDRTAREHFQFLLHERNYFVHRLHLCLSEYPSDQFQLRQFVNRAKGVSDEMEFFGRLLNEARGKNA